MFHLLAAPGALTGVYLVRDRPRSLHRPGQDARRTPRPWPAPTDLSTLSNTDGSVLDPIVAIRVSVPIAPDKSASVQIITGVAETREAALALVDKYGDRHFVERAFEMAWFQSQEILRLLNITEADAQIYGRLATSVIHGSALAAGRLPASSRAIA